MDTQNPTDTMPSRISFSTALFSFLLFLALAFGWKTRDEYFLSAEFGLGYALGIIGGSMMLLLLVYPLKKRFYDSALFIFSTKSWFKLHMAFGVLGPLLVLYHCNFNLGSTNSNIALSSMLLMVASGIVGRFIYSKIHFGLYGKKVELRELQTKKLLVEKQIDDDRHENIIFMSETLITKLQAFETTVLKRRSLTGTFFNILTLGITTRLGYFSLTKCLKNDQQGNNRYSQLPQMEQHQHLKATRIHIANYLSTVRKIAGLGFYERLFYLWHMLHMPIFFMLIITGFIHVFAVHTY